jgi:hypothetical protein
MVPWREDMNSEFLILDSKRLRLRLRLRKKNPVNGERLTANG